jgi:hypothetical protein
MSQDGLILSGLAAGFTVAVCAWLIYQIRAIRREGRKK